MKTLLPLIIFSLNISSCQKPPPDTSSANPTTTPAQDTTTTTLTPPKTDEPIYIGQADNTITLMLDNKKVLSFELPDSATTDVSTGRYGHVVADWEPRGLVTYKSFVFQVQERYCSLPGDEGTSTELVDTLAHGPGFAHGTFDNLVAGAYGIEELYFVVFPGYCVRFNWTLGMSDEATADDRKNEIQKMEEFLKTVKFE